MLLEGLEMAGELKNQVFVFFFFREFPNLNTSVLLSLDEGETIESV